eukprot:evm.model.scf_2205.1 EVM.evm.TU.scf_2205.1   scf_2205:1018-3768(+)
MVVMEQRVVVGKPFERPAPNGPSVQASSPLPQSNGCDWSIGCHVTLRTTLGEELTGSVFTFDRLTNCLALVEDGDAPGLVNFRVLKATFIKEVVSAQRPAQPTPQHLPFVDLMEGFRREQMALDVSSAPVAPSTSHAAPADPWDQVDGIGEGRTTTAPDSAVGHLLDDHGGPKGGVLSPGQPGAAVLAFDTVDVPISPKPMAREMTRASPPAWSPGPPPGNTGLPVPATVPTTPNGRQQNSGFSPPRQVAPVAQAPAWSAITTPPKSRPWSQGCAPGGALSKTSCGPGMVGRKVDAPAVGSAVGADPPDSPSLSRAGSSGAPLPAPGMPALRGRWSKGKPNILQDP